MNKIRRFGFLVTIRNFRRAPVISERVNKSLLFNINLDFVVSVCDGPTNLVSETLMQGSFFNDLYIVQTLHKAEVAFVQVLY